MKKNRKISVTLVINILSCDKNNVKKEIVELIQQKAKKQKNKKVNTALTIAKMANFLSTKKAEDVIRFAFDNKYISKKICESFSKKINCFMGIYDEQNKIEVNNVKYITRGKGMKLKLEIDELDVDALFERIILSSREMLEKKLQKKGKDGLGDTQRIFYESIFSLNKEIASEEKIELIKLLLTWSNKNKVIQTIIKTIIDENEKYAEILKPLQLSIGNINLE